jgi:hypothetical protein
LTKVLLVVVKDVVDVLIVEEDVNVEVVVEV